MSELPTLPVTFRPGRTRALLHALGAACFVTITVIALVLDTMSPAERSSFVFTAALFWGVLGLLARPRVVADDTGVTVVNVARSRRLDWAEIVGVNLRPGDPWVFLDLADGTSLAAMGIQPGMARQSAVRDARALRALTEAHSTVRS
ncbi:PH domain-containing protein [Streptomyces sp. SID5785]|uniref:PH domain-containing protein n=1 Tax=Streptomyces sp. SID5785 TaxID=2690309 RepID=UPI001361A771|nr:PH domain-containing protein [Streptomyces sp. SID5785]MZD10324.1 PH domain-containing protein [Streptomyces sp. SID5785]